MARGHHVHVPPGVLGAAAALLVAGVIYVGTLPIA